MTNYRRGYEIERKIMNQFRVGGYVALRSAGSHSPFDVVAIGPNVVMLIQVKRTKRFQPKQYDNDLKALRKIAVPDCCLKQLWVWEDKKGFKTFSVIR
jgi:Holliday junction resolvase